MSFGPNCRLTAEYRIAMGIQSLRLQTHIPVIPTRPPESAPKEAPNRLFGSFQVKKNSIFNICVGTSNQVRFCMGQCVMILVLYVFAGDLQTLKKKIK